MAAVGLLESLLTAQIVDDMTDTDSSKRVECAGQGGANIVAALFGGAAGAWAGHTGGGNMTAPAVRRFGVAASTRI
jgi:MFS superfamily sulfate permease-like transporter